MSWYAIQSGELKTKNDSLVIAFANLLLKLGYDALPAEIAEDLAAIELNWDAVTEYTDELYPLQIGDYGTWPETNNAIVKFRCISARTGLAVDHFCMVASATDKTIVDSLDGEVKSPGIYGQPTGWASYVLEQEDDPAAVPEALEEEVVDNRSVTVNGAGESCWDLSRRLRIENLSGQDIADHNDIDDAQAKLPPFSKVRIPFDLPESTRKPGIRFEVLEEPLDMHISKEGGTRQFTFGMHERWEQLKETGQFYAENSNITVHAVAYVPIAEDDKEAAFYMTTTSLGDFVETGKVRWATGFNHSHLTEGHVEATQALPVAPAVQERLEEVKAVLEAPKPAPVTVQVMDIVARPPVVATPPTEVQIPDDDSDIDELQNEISQRLDFPTRVAIHGRLSPVERYFTVPFAKLMAQKVRLFELFKTK